MWGDVPVISGVLRVLCHLLSCVQDTVHWVRLNDVGWVFFNRDVKKCEGKF